jgi:hypothetical protein
VGEQPVTLEEWKAMTPEQKKAWLGDRDLVYVYGHFVAAELYYERPEEIRALLLRKVMRWST